jgi:hypothetical protein
LSSSHFPGLPLIPGAAQTLKTLCKEKNDLEFVVVTSRQKVIQDATVEWLRVHFPGVFKQMYFGNQWNDTQEPYKKKSDMCREACASILIDDNPEYALE